jgi:hypothetical protein
VERWGSWKILKSPFKRGQEVYDYGRFVPVWSPEFMPKETEYSFGEKLFTPISPNPFVTPNSQTLQLHQLHTPIIWLFYV